MTDQKPTMGRWLQAGGAIHALVGITAILGGGALCIWPSGSMLHADRALLAHTPFTDFLLPGLALYLLGVTNALVGYLSLPGSRGSSRCLCSRAWGC